MIINESERNRIKSLYGLIREDAPPSESVVVANKNPFKYPEYENARKVYSSELKDGDLFYKLVYRGSRLYLEELFDAKVEKFIIGKTIRIESLDNIVTVDRVSLEKYPRTDRDRNFEIDDNSGKFQNYILNVSFDSHSGSLYRIHISADDVNFFGKYTSPRDGTKYLPYFGNFVEFCRKLVPSYIESAIKLKSFEDDHKIIDQKFVEDIPDKYFEIRKIQRQNTDF